MYVYSIEGVLYNEYKIIMQLHYHAGPLLFDQSNIIIYIKIPFGRMIDQECKRRKSTTVDRCVVINHGRDSPGTCR